MINEQQPTATIEGMTAWINAFVNREFPQVGDDFDMAVGAMRHSGRTTGKAVYEHLAPEIAALKAERDVYRKALEDIAGIDKYPRLRAQDTLQQYPSPSPKIDKDNGIQ